MNATHRVDSGVNSLTSLLVRPSERISHGYPLPHPLSVKRDRRPHAIICALKAFYEWAMMVCERASRRGIF